MFFQNAYQLLNQNREYPLVLKNLTFFFLFIKLKPFRIILQYKFSLFELKDFTGRKVIQQKEVSVSIIKDNNVFNGSTFVMNRFPHLFEFSQTYKVNLSLFIKTQIFSRY